MAIISLNSCIGISKVYKYQGKKNLVVYTKTDSNVQAYLDIYKLKGKCGKYLEGRVKLNNGNTHISLLNNQKYYLHVDFSSLLLESGQIGVGNITLGSQIVTKPNHLYKIEATYIDDMYDVLFFKKALRGNSMKEINLKPLNKCPKNSSKPFVEINWFSHTSKEVLE